MGKYLGEEIGKLGFGLMRLPELEKGKFDIPQLKEMVDLYMDAGYNYFDTSWGYIGSEAAAKEALTSRYPRESYILATKCPVWVVKTKEAAQNMLADSLERLGVDYIDYYLLHNINVDRKKVFDKYDMWNFAVQKKKEGLVKHIGFSFHDKADYLEELLVEHPEMEFVQLQINYADWENPAIESRKCYEVARKHNKPVIVMEPVKGGVLANVPEKVSDILKGADPEVSLSSWAMRFATDMEGLITVLSGMSNVDQMQDNLKTMKNFRPLTEDERETLRKATEALDSYNTVPCTYCQYCMSKCPKEIPIPFAFEAMNMYEVYGDLPYAKNKYFWNAKGVGKPTASECIACGECEKVCPQHIKVIDELKKASELFD